MSRFINYIKSLFTKTEDEFTKLTRLPIGMTEFHQWADSIINKSGLPNNDSVKLSLAKMVTQLGHDVASAPKSLFVALLHKAAANQIAFAVNTEIRAKQAASDAVKQVENVVAPTTTGGQN